MDNDEYPMRINKYLAHKKHCTRREADEYVAAGKVMLNGRKAVLGDKVTETDTVEVLFRPQKHRYYVFNKPRNIVTHSPQEFEQDIRQVVPLTGIFPIGRLDKDSHGLIILTDDGRITDKLLHPDFNHEKEYEVSVQEELKPDFADLMSSGVLIDGGYTTRPCTVEVLGKRTFTIVLTEGKKHQIRRMAAALGYTTTDLERIRIMNIEIGKLDIGTYRPIVGTELKRFLELLGFGG